MLCFCKIVQEVAGGQGEDDGDDGHVLHLRHAAVLGFLYSTRVLDPVDKGFADFLGRGVFALFLDLVRSAAEVTLVPA